MIPKEWPDLMKAAARAGGPARLLRKHETIGMLKGAVQALGATTGIVGLAYKIGQVKGRSQVENTDQA